jgi:capsule polysaccharide export protein KpsE/RkpR
MFPLENGLNMNVNNTINPSQSTMPSQSGAISIKEVLLFLWHNRILILGITVVVMIVSILVALFSPSVYQSTSKLVSKTPGNQTSGSMAQLAALAGVNVGVSSGTLDPSEYLPEVIKNYAFMQKLLKKKWLFNNDSLYFCQIFKMKPDTNVEDWQKKFDKKQSDEIREGNFIRLSKDFKTGLLTLTTQFPTPQLAYDVNIYCLDLIDKYILNSMKSQAKDKKSFIEQRLNDVKKDLADCENRLVGFKERNVNIIAPKVFLEEQRILRQIEFNQQVYIELQKQYELARIQELNDQPLIEVIAQPEPPIVRTKPKRKLILIFGTLFGVFMGVFVAFAGNWWQVNFNSKCNEKV